MLNAAQLGLSKKHYQQLNNAFKQQPKISKVKIYGSRAKGNFSERSDIDLALYGDQLNRFIISDLLMDLDESDIPYTVDAQNFANIQNPRLKEHIQRMGKTIYRVEST